MTFFTIGSHHPSTQQLDQLWNNFGVSSGQDPGSQFYHLKNLPTKFSPKWETQFCECVWYEYNAMHSLHAAFFNISFSENTCIVILFSTCKIEDNLLWCKAIQCISWISLRCCSVMSNSNVQLIPSMFKVYEISLYWLSFELRVNSFMLRE